MTDNTNTAATSGDAPADLTMYQAQSEFSDYFSKNYPMDTIIADPDWHSTKIWKAAMSILGRVERIEPAAASGDDLPPLPRHEYCLNSQPVLEGYTAHQMRDYARAAVSAATKPTADLPRPTDDELWDATLRDRDTYHEWADKLAEAISKHFDAYIGEHSNANCPWAEALEAIEFYEDERPAHFAALLPGPYYMDPPDGGSVSILEQFKRMAEDAAQWRSLLATKPAAAPVVPEEWREFVKQCSTFAGQMVNGNQLSRVAADLLAVTPAASTPATEQDQAHVMPHCAAPKGPFADYSAEEVEAFAKHYAHRVLAANAARHPDFWRYEHIANGLRRRAEKAEAELAELRAAASQDMRERFHTFVKSRGGSVVRREGHYIESMTALWWECWVAASTTGAAQTAEQVRNQALDEAAELVSDCDKRATLKGIACAIRALKSAAPEGAEGEGNG